MDETEFKGAIFVNALDLVKEPMTDTLKELANKAEKDSSNVRRVLNGRVNATIDTFGHIAEAKDCRATMIMLPESDYLDDVLQRSGERLKHFWRIPGLTMKNPHGIADFFLNVFVKSHYVKNLSVAIYKWIGIVTLSANKLNIDELTELINKQADDIAKRSVPDDDDRDPLI